MEQAGKLLEKLGARLGENRKLRGNMDVDMNVTVMFLSSI